MCLSVLKISMVGDVQESSDCDSTRAGYGSTALINHTSGSDDNSFPSLLLLEEIDLRGNRMTSVPSWLFLRFPFLQRVDVSQNRVESLPFAVWACTSLVELNLSGNRLSSLSCAQMESMSFPLDGDLDQRPGTPASCASEASVSSDVQTVISTTDLSVEVRHLERWRDRVEVRPVSYLAGASARSSQVV